MKVGFHKTIDGKNVEVSEEMAPDRAKCVTLLEKMIKHDSGSVNKFTHTNKNGTLEMRFIMAEVYLFANFGKEEELILAGMSGYNGDWTWGTKYAIHQMEDKHFTLLLSALVVWAKDVPADIKREPQTLSVVEV